jgi:hypothetical protein
MPAVRSDGEICINLATEKASSPKSEASADVAAGIHR